MKKIVFVAIVLLLVVSLTGCYHVKETDVTKVNKDGSPIWTTEVPQSNKYVYGVGSAKLSNHNNSQNSADVNARADLARKLQYTMNEAITVYSNEAEAVVRNAYEQLSVQTVSLTVRGVNTVSRWTAGDKTVWSLVSFKVRDLEELFELAANDYQKQLEKQKADIQAKYLALVAEIEAEKKAGTNSFGVDLDGLLKSSADYSTKAEADIQKQMNGLNTSGVLSELAKQLQAAGYVR